MKKQKRLSKKEIDNYIVLIEAENLSLNDKFMKYEPKTSQEKETKDLITKVIKEGVKNFYHPILDPSFTDNGSGICYVPGNMPAIQTSYDWHEKAAKEFMPERNSRLGTRLEYGAFLGVLIKNLVASGWSIKKAWRSVCVKSGKLGCYFNSTIKTSYKPTGSRFRGGFYDLANVYKVLAYEENIGVWLASGSSYQLSNRYPVAHLGSNANREDDRYACVAWVVLEK